MGLFKSLFGGKQHPRNRKREKMNKKNLRDFKIRRHPRQRMGKLPYSH